MPIDLFPHLSTETRARYQALQAQHRELLDDPRIEALRKQLRDDKAQAEARARASFIRQTEEIRRAVRS